MAKAIVYYEVTNSYDGILKGIRFKVTKDSSKHIDACIKEGLAEETGVPTNKINLSMLKCVEI